MVDNRWWRWQEVNDNFGINLSEDVNVIYYEMYSDWSWSDQLTIFEEDDRIYYNEGDEWFPQATNIEDAIQMMLNFEANL